MVLQSLPQGAAAAEPAAVGGREWRQRAARRAAWRLGSAGSAGSVWNRPAATPR